LFVFLFFKANVSIGQGSAFFPILSVLYIASIFHIFKKRSKNLLSPIPVLILLFVDNRLFVSQEKSYKKSNVNLFCSYNIILSLFNQFGLVIKHNKSEVFYFLRLTKNIYLPLLDLRSLDDSLLHPKYMWRYLDFFLTTCQALSRSLTVDFILFSPFTLFYFTLLFPF